MTTTRPSSDVSHAAYLACHAVVAARLAGADADTCAQVYDDAYAAALGTVLPAPVERVSRFRGLVSWITG